MTQAKKANGGNPVTDSVTTTTPPLIAEAAASISTLSVQPDADVSTLSMQGGADVAPRNNSSSSSMAREPETAAVCGKSSNGPLCLGAEVLGFRGSPSIGVEYSTQGAPKQSPYDCSHMAMTYTALAILATLTEPAPTHGTATGSAAGNAAGSLPDVRQHPAEESSRGGAGLLGEQVDERSSEGVGARGEDGNGVLDRWEDGVCARGGDGVDATAACNRVGEVRGMAKSLRELQLQDGSSIFQLFTFRDSSFLPSRLTPPTPFFPPSSFMPVACGSESDMRFVFCAVQSVRFLLLIRTVSLSQHLLPCSPLPFKVTFESTQAAISSMIGDWRGVDIPRAVAYIQRSQVGTGHMVGEWWGLVGSSGECVVVRSGRGDWRGVDIPRAVDYIQKSQVGTGHMVAEWWGLVGSSGECVVVRSGRGDWRGVDIPRTVDYIQKSQRQGAEGGFQGRRNKPADTCYAFWWALPLPAAAFLLHPWVGGTLSMRERIHLIDHARGTLVNLCSYCHSPPTYVPSLPSYPSLSDPWVGGTLSMRERIHLIDHARGTLVNLCSYCHSPPTYVPSLPSYPSLSDPWVGGTLSMRERIHLIDHARGTLVNLCSYCHSPPTYVPSLPSYPSLSDPWIPGVGGTLSMLGADHLVDRARGTLVTLCSYCRFPTHFRALPPFLSLSLSPRVGGTLSMLGADHSHAQGTLVSLCSYRHSPPTPIPSPSLSPRVGGILSMLGADHSHARGALVTLCSCPHLPPTPMPSLSLTHTGVGGTLSMLAADFSRPAHAAVHHPLPCPPSLSHTQGMVGAAASIQWDSLTSSIPSTGSVGSAPLDPPLPHPSLSPTTEAPHQSPCFPCPPIPLSMRIQCATIEACCLPPAQQRPNRRFRHGRDPPAAPQTADPRKIPLLRICSPKPPVRPARATTTPLSRAIAAPRVAAIAAAAAPLPCARSPRALERALPRRRNWRRAFMPLPLAVPLTLRRKGDAPQLRSVERARAPRCRARTLCSYERALRSRAHPRTRHRCPPPWRPSPF
ncbi:unnamed protein product [Closterium sp. Naga37s-1]|nr:unnamed protein product [Closterium sp. Naga37s-1]